MQNKKYILFFALAVGVLFGAGHAEAAVLRDVVINEISWSGASTTQWLELRNASDTAINMAGWTITNIANVIPGNTNTTTIATSTGFSTTTIPASGYFLIGHATSGNSVVSDSVTIYATDTVNLIGNYLQNGALVLRDNAGVLIDETPASSTAAWPAGLGAPATSTMARNYTIATGTSTASWHTSIVANNFDPGASDKGTPGYYNGYLVSGTITQLNGTASGTVYILVQNHIPGPQPLATFSQNTTGTYAMHIFGSASSSNPYSTTTPTLYDFLGFRDSGGTSTQYDAGIEPRQSLNNSGAGFNLTSVGTTTNFSIAVNPQITGVTATNIGASTTISGLYFGDSTTTAQAMVYIPNNIAAGNYITFWSATSIIVTIPPATQMPETTPQTGQLQVEVGWTPRATSTLTIKPKITSAAATVMQVTVNFDSFMDGMGGAMTASNYTLNGSAVPPTAWVDFRGNQVILRNLSLTQGNTFTILADSDVKSVAGTAVDTNFNSATGTVATAPAITSVTPSSTSTGGVVTIAGTNFGASTGTVSFSPGPPTPGSPPPEPIAATVGSWSNTSITATIPATAKSGPVFVTTAAGVQSDFSQSAFVDIMGNAAFNILEANTNNVISSTTARIIIGAMGGPRVYAAGDSNVTYSNGTTTITGISSMGFAWAYDNSGDHVSARGQMLNTATTTVFILATSTTKISGNITNATPNTTLVVFADPVEGSGQNMEFKEPIFVTTNGNGTTSYSVGLSATGTYSVGVENPGFGGTASSSPSISPGRRTVNASTTTAVSGINFAFTAATARIRGQIQKATGQSFNTGPGMEAFHVWAYQPVENGLSASAMPNASGTFDLYVNPGVYIIGVGGPDLPFPIEKQIEVKSGDTNFATSNTAVDITLVIKAPTEYISGRVTDSNSNAIAGASIFAWNQSGPGGGQAFTDSSGYYKLYVNPGIYNIDGFAPDYGKLTFRSGVEVVLNSSTTVDFSVSSDMATISGTVTKNSALTSDIEIWITQGENGWGMNRTRTDATGAFSIRVPYGSGYWIHAAMPGKGEIYRANLPTFSSTVSTTSVAVSLNTATINVRISPASLFSQAFVEARDITTSTSSDRGFSDKDVSTDSSYRQYSIDVPRPASGNRTYTIQGGIPGYGPIAPTTTVIAAGTASTTISITLGSGYTVSGSVADPDASTTGNQAEGAFVWAASPNGHGGGQVNASGTFSFILRGGTYDFGINKENYTGNMISNLLINGTTTLDGATTTLSLTSAASTITGTTTISSTPESGAWVWATNGSGGWAGDETDGNGVYILKVNSGSWQVQAVSDGGYQSARQNVDVTNGATTTLDISLIATSYTSATPTVSSITPKTGGLIQGSGVSLDAPAGALSSSDSNTGRVSISKTTSVPQTNSVRALGGSAYEITATNASGTQFNVLNDAVTITLTYTAAELSAAGISQASSTSLSLGYWDSTANTWTAISTNAATTSDGGVTYTGTTRHLSAYAPLVSSGATPPPTPSNPTATAGDGSVALSWGSSAGASLYNVYRLSSGLYPFLASTTATFYTNSGLTNGTTYSYKVSAENSGGDESTSTDAVSATPQAAAATPAPSGGGAVISGGSAGDTTPPAISGINITVGDTTAAISWKTDESSISWLAYGTSTNYGLEKKTTTATLSHSLTLTGLSASTAYHYQIKAKDSAENTSSYTDKTFTTLALGETAKVVEETKKQEKPKQEQAAVKPISQMTVAELKAEISRLVALIAQLQSRLVNYKTSTGQTERPAGFIFRKNLSSGVVDDDVPPLKELLVREGCLTDSRGTKLFGSKTKEGVKCFCQQYKTEIEQSIGVEVKCSGLVGRGVRAKLNQIIGSASPSPSPTPSPSPSPMPSPSPSPTPSPSATPDTSPSPSPTPSPTSTPLSSPSPTESQTPSPSPEPTSSPSASVTPTP